MALLGEFMAAAWRLNAWNLLMPQPAWLAPYIDNPVYAEARNRHRAHAKRQQKALLEKNGGRFPLPQDQ